MPTSTVSHPLLAHFDGPEIAVENVPLRVETTRRVRDVGWVLKWAGVLGMLFVTACFLIAFGYRLAAEQALASAARAGILEATLPQATYESVQRMVARRLTNYSLQRGELQIALQQNGVLVRGPLYLREGDRLSLLVTLPNRAALPAWLSVLSFGHGEKLLQALVDRQLPDRHLRLSTPDAG